MPMVVARCGQVLSADGWCASGASAAARGAVEGRGQRQSCAWAAASRGFICRAGAEDRKKAEFESGGRRWQALAGPGLGITMHHFCPIRLLLAGSVVPSPLPHLRSLTLICMSNAWLRTTHSLDRLLGTQRGVPTPRALSYWLASTRRVSWEVDTRPFHSDRNRRIGPSFPGADILQSAVSKFLHVHMSYLCCVIPRSRSHAQDGVARPRPVKRNESKSFNDALTPPMIGLEDSSYY